MRTINNKKMELNRMLIQVDSEKNQQVVVDQMTKSSYFKQLLDIVTMPPKNGWNTSNLEQLQTRISLQKKFKEESKKSVKIEEHEYKELLVAAEGYGLLITTEEVLTFFSYIKNLPLDK